MLNFVQIALISLNYQCFERIQSAQFKYGAVELEFKVLNSSEHFQSVVNSYVRIQSQGLQFQNLLWIKLYFAVFERQNFNFLIQSSKLYSFAVSNFDLIRRNELIQGFKFIIVLNFHCWSGTILQQLIYFYYLTKEQSLLANTTQIIRELEFFAYKSWDNAFKVKSFKYDDIFGYISLISTLIIVQKGKEM
ncbi:Hypothetical_protein [Hexamita inflata]|uniref:Hypothetical_protein n=1 Tax=Hexamita inflata TaxID=28002 RepID=A0AA86Q1T8_9EUKA|nr:Hypothetical protein HINF_LOCUS23268 [Hexamita inflata]CAI9949673.1 Hypothetical protein HINF_LOCUS37318 [Hexamita inflata]